MKIEVKYNINFGKALEHLNESRLTKIVNQHFSRKIAPLASKAIEGGKITPKLSDNNPRKIKNKSAKPLFDTGALAKSIKGGPLGIGSIHYGKYHRKEGGYTAWGKVKVEQREFIPHLKDGKISVKGTKSDVLKIYKEFKDKFNKLLSKSIRKR